MNDNMVKTIFTYVFALVALVGSMLLLRFPPAGIPPEALLTFVVGITSASLGYVFGERSAASGAASAGSTQVHTPQATVTGEPVLVSGDVATGEETGEPTGPRG